MINGQWIMAQKMKTLGTEWLIEAAGCRPDALRDVVTLAALFDCVIAELKLRPVAEPVWHQFPDEGGVTGFVLLAESHLTCHTWPERQSAAFNLFCCKPRPAWRWAETLRETLGAVEVNVRQICR
jgi:S-adenosylmethionine decarboxylase